MTEIELLLAKVISGLRLDQFNSSSLNLAEPMCFILWAGRAGWLRLYEMTFSGLYVMALSEGKIWRTVPIRADQFDDQPEKD